MPPSDMDFTHDADVGWNQRLLEETASNPGSDPFALPPDAPVGPAVAPGTLRAIAEVGNDLAGVINLVSGVVRTTRASQDASDRADSALALLQSRYATQTSEAIGAAAIQQARAMIQSARTQDDMAATAVFLRRALAVQKAAQLSERGAKAPSSDLVPILLALGVLGAAGWYWHRSTRRRVSR